MPDITTVVLGASTNPARYAFLATQRLQEYGFTAIPIGIKEGKIGEIDIVMGRPDLENIHTVTLYLNPMRQKEYYDYILGLQPKRIIFNPGTENSELMELAKQHNVETIEACTLVMLSIGNYADTNDTSIKKDEQA